MSNHHLRNSSLTLKAKGLLSQMLSLSENWDYTLAGLSRINKENVEATMAPAKGFCRLQKRRAHILSGNLICKQGSVNY